MTYMVAATDEIRHPNSLIARFLRSEFPVLDDLAADFQRRLEGAETLGPRNTGSDFPWSLVGTAIDYRLRFLFEILPVTHLQAFRSAQGFHISDKGTALDEQVPFPYGPEGRIRAYMPKVSADLFVALRDFQRRGRPARHVLSTHDEAWLCRYCAGLALVDVKILQRLRTQTHPLQALPPGSTLDDLFGLIPREAVADVYRLSRRFQETTAREWFRTSVTFDPCVWIGNIGASPDVLVGDRLLDMKTVMRPRMDRIWLDQILLYVLAVGDRDQVKHVGYQLIRQARTIAWPIEEFATRAAGTSAVDLDRLSQVFFDVAARSSFTAPKERWGRSD